jgi:hypothetical protein
MMLSITCVTGGRELPPLLAAGSRRAAEAGDLVDPDAVDLLGRLHHLADDLGHAVEPVLLELHPHQLVAARVLGRDQRARAFRLGGQADALRLGAGRRRRRLGLRGHQQHRGLALCLRGLDLAALLLALQRDLARAVGDRALALGLQLLLGQHDLGPRELGLGLRLRLLGVLQRERDRAVDLADLGIELGLDLEPSQLARLLDLGDPGVLLALDARVLRGDGRLLAGARGVGVARRLQLLDLEALPDLRLLFLARQLQPLLDRLELRLPHRDVGIGLDLGALLLAGRDDLGELAQADRVERVVVVEGGERGLVHPRQRNRFELQPARRQVVAHRLADRLDEFGAPVVQRVHRQARRGRLDRVDEAAFEQVAHAVRAQRLRADRLRGGRDTVDRRLHAQVELELDVDPHPVLGDQRFRAGPHHLDAHRPHVDLVDLVQERQREAAARQHDLLAAEAGADDRDVARRLAVEAAQEGDRDGDRDDQDDQAEQPGQQGHGFSSI